MTEYRNQSSLAEYYFGYLEKRTTPTQRIVHDILPRLAELNDDYVAFALVNITDVKRQCRESDARWAHGTPLSPLDGIPVAIKDSAAIMHLPPPTAGSYLFHARMMNLSVFMTSQFGDDNIIIRERQDNKVRFEVGSSPSQHSPASKQTQDIVDMPQKVQGGVVSISSLFGVIEENKILLRLEDYGVSQTSLEQVFNMHAAAAEETKKNTVD